MSALLYRCPLFRDISKAGFHCYSMQKIVLLHVQSYAYIGGIEGLAGPANTTPLSEAVHVYALSDGFQPIIINAYQTF